MNRTMAVVTFAATLASLQAGAQAQDAPQEGPIEIDKCQAISQPGSYKLVNNLTFKGPAGTACLSIAANFVTIDLAGFTITGNCPPGPLGFPTCQAAIEAGETTESITVRNGSISGNFIGGVALSGDGSIVEGLHVSNIVVGISAKGIVKGNTAYFYVPHVGGTGIEATGLITGNYVSRMVLGISAGQGSTVIGNTVTNPIESGIQVNCPSNVIDNTATGSPPPFGANLVLNGTGCNNTNNVAP